MVCVQIKHVTCGYNHHVEWLGNILNSYFCAIVIHTINFVVFLVQLDLHFIKSQYFKLVWPLNKHMILPTLSPYFNLSLNFSGTVTVSKFNSTDLWLGETMGFGCEFGFQAYHMLIFWLSIFHEFYSTQFFICMIHNSIPNLQDDFAE